MGVAGTWVLLVDLFGDGSHAHMGVAGGDLFGDGSHCQVYIGGDSSWCLCHDYLSSREAGSYGTPIMGVAGSPGGADLFVCLWY